MHGGSNDKQSVLDELKRRFPELGENAPLNGGDAVDRLNGWFCELAGDAECKDSGLADGLEESERLRCLYTARDVYGSDDIEIDFDAALSVGNGIVWVSAWVCLLGNDLPRSMRDEPGNAC